MPAGEAVTQVTQAAQQAGALPVAVAEWGVTVAGSAAALAALWWPTGAADSTFLLAVPLTALIARRFVGRVTHGFRRLSGRPVEHRRPAAGRAHRGPDHQGRGHARPRGGPGARTAGECPRPGTGFGGCKGHGLAVRPADLADRGGRARPGGPRRRRRTALAGGAGGGGRLPPARLPGGAADRRVLHARPGAGRRGRPRRDLHAPGRPVRGRGPRPGGGRAGLPRGDRPGRRAEGPGRPGGAVLDRIDLDIPAGACVALVGRTASGKSALAGLPGRLRTRTKERCCSTAAPSGS